ncbi:melanopsin-A-like isoform X2 [Rhopilema esculentum]|uniref:melanopsin-A-like isoform X2 n=1 Tax=Rhopilema esculentum TaxID=499914 RepID=UPI0031D159BD
MEMMNNSSSNPEHVYLPVYEKAIMSVVIITLAFTGTIGNCLTCVIFLQNRMMRTSANLLIVNLAIADVLQSLNMSFLVFNLLNGGWILGGGLCQFCGWSNMTFIITSLFSLALISLSRYFAVVKTNGKYSFTKRAWLAMAIAAWTTAGLHSLAPVFGWSVYEYRAGKLMCTLKFSDSLSYSVTTMSIAIGFPFSTICYTTYKIIKKVKQSNVRVANSSVMTERKRKEENRISLMLLSVILCFVIFYSPASVINLVQMGYGDSYKIPFRLDAWTVILAMFNHANNPIIYCILNSNFRRGLRAICSADRRKQIRSNVDVTMDTRKTNVAA